MHFPWIVWFVHAFYTCACDHALAVPCTCCTVSSASYRGWGALRFPTPKLKFPPSRFAPTAILCITFPPQMASAPQHSCLKSHGSIWNAAVCAYKVYVLVVFVHLGGYVAISVLSSLWAVNPEYTHCSFPVIWLVKYICGNFHQIRYLLS